MRHGAIHQPQVAVDTGAGRRCRLPHGDLHVEGGTAASRRIPLAADPVRVLGVMNAHRVVIAAIEVVVRGRKPDAHLA